MTARIAWHWVVAAACFAALAALRAADGSHGEVVALATAAVVAGALAVARSRSGGAQPPPPRQGAGSPDPGAVRRTHDVHLARLRSWRACAAVGLVAAAGGLVLFPLLALAVAPVVVVALLRVRRYGRDVRVLAHALDTPILTGARSREVSQ